MRTATLLLLASLLLAGPREDALQAWKDQGEKHLAEARADLAKRKDEAARRHAAGEARLREATTKAPVEIDLGGGKLLHGCVVVEVKDDGFVVKAADPAVQMKVLFAALPARTVFDLQKAMLDPEDVAGRFALGRLAARLGLYADAQKEFDAVVAKDPSYKDRLPDLEQLKHRATLFHGKMTALGADRYRVVYDFAADDEAQDFAVEGGTAKVEKGSIVLEGDDDVQLSLRELALSGEVALSVDAPPAAKGAQAIWGLTFTCAAGKSFGLAVTRDGEKGKVLTEENLEADWEEGDPFDLSGPVRLSLAHGTALSVKSGDKEVWSKEIAPVQTCQPFLEGGVEEKGDFQVAFDKMEVEGRIPHEFLRKLAADVEAAAMRTLEDDLVAGAIAAVAKVEDLSAYALCPDPLPDDARKELERIRADLAKEEVDDDLLDKDVEALEAMTKAQPKFAGSWLALAEAQAFEGREDLEIEDLDKAIAVEPAFHEALAARAALHVERREREAAERDVEGALAVRPDEEAAIRTRGYLRTQEKKYAEAIADFELALALDPADAQAASYLKAARHLSAGPWPEGSGKTEHKKETEHYVIRTDISMARAEQYATRLEKARAIYEKGVPPAAGPAKKAVVLVFDSEEAYHTYAELTQDDRAESTLGYYSPFYEQLFLFEGATDMSGLETMHTLYHEGFHQYLDPIVSDPPTWLDEGLADYYAGKVLEAELGGKRDPDVQAMVADLKGAIGSGWETDFAKIMEMSQPDFYADGAYTRYAQGWSMCYWFQEVAPAEAKGAFAEYFASLRARKGYDEAFEGSFGKIDLAAAEKAWKEWITGLEY